MATSLLREHDLLTKSERRVVDLVCAGKRPKEVALETGLALDTVHTYLKKARKKFGVHTMATLVTTARAARDVSLANRLRRVLGHHIGENVSIGRALLEEILEVLSVGPAKP